MKKEYLINMFIIFFFLILNLLTFKAIEFSKYLLLFNIFSWLLIIFRLRKKQSLMIIGIYILTFSIYLIPYYFYGIRLASYFTFYSDKYFLIVLRSNSIFTTTIILFMKKCVNKMPLKNYLRIKNKPITYAISVMILLYIVAFGISGNNILNNGVYGSGSSKTTSMLEYSYIFIIMAYISSGKKAWKNNLIIAYSTMFSIKLLLYGNRIQVLQMMLLIFILYFENKISLKMLFNNIIIGFLSFEFIGRIRSNIGEIKTINLKSLILSGNSKRLINTQTDIFYSSAAIMGIVDEKFIDVSTRIKSLYNFILRIFLPSNLVSNEGVISSYVQSFAPTGGGGLVNAHFYFWLGDLGVILSAYLFLRVINNYIKIRKKEIKLINIYGILILILTPRWFSYGPIHLFKMPLYLVLIYYLSMLEEKFYS